MTAHAGTSRGLRARSLRRYPGLAFLAVAALLAVALPSALTVPNAGPPTLAEFAPVPGQGIATGGDVARLGAGSSGGPGGGAGPGVPEGPLEPGQPLASLKRCVGNPPRQTEDPLSPPCVAFFDGDNGGATWRGVTRDEVVVVIYRRSTTRTPNQGSPPPPGTIVDYDEPPSQDDFFKDFAAKVYMRYFNERYQTYGRRVHAYGFYGPAAGADVNAARRADAGRVDELLTPFASIAVATTTPDPYLDEAAARGMVTFFPHAFRRDFYRARAPLLWSYLPDLENQAQLISDYVCRKLAGRRARYSGNATDTSARRVLGIAYTESPRQPEYAFLKDLVTEALRRRCGAKVAAAAGASDAFDQAEQDAPAAIAALRAENVTTVITLALPNSILAMAQAASATGWFPEWVVGGRRDPFGLDQGATGKLMPPEQWRRAFGVTFSPRWGNEGEMHWSRSFRETCSCEPRDRWDASLLYDPLAMLFHGIQAAGPRLTPHSLAKGMHAIPQHASIDPFTPAAYFPTGEHSYVKDATEIWWDPAGPSPGDPSPGCYRLPSVGRRFRAGEWPQGDEGSFAPGPCNGNPPVTG